MSFSNDFIKALLDQHTAEAFIWLLTVEHAESGQAFRFCSNIEDTLSRGNTFAKFPFDLTLPDDDGDALPAISIELKHTTGELLDVLRRYGSGAGLTVELIMASNPDTVQYTIDDLIIKTVPYDDSQTTLTAAVEDVLNQRYPADDYLPRSFPGMFK